MFKLLKFNGFLVYILSVFLNAFIDLGHKITIQNTIFKSYDGEQQIILTAIINALILIPFIMALSPAGFCSDKYPKNKIIQISAWVAVGLCLLITLFYYLGWFWMAFAITLMLALQSAFYSPAKYGYIRELLGKENITAANGLVQATTTIAILAGIFIFSIIFETQLAGAIYKDQSALLAHIAPIGWCLVGCSLLQLMLVYKLPKKKEKDQDMHFDWRQYSKGYYLKNNINSILENRLIMLAVIGLALFWGLSQVVLAVFPAHAKEVMLITNAAVIQGMMTCAGIGIIFGSLICARTSKFYIETGLIPAAALGLSLCLLLLSILQDTVALLINFFAWGVLGGMLVVPLEALIQSRAKGDQLGRILAGSNLIQNIAMLSFLGLTVASTLFNINSYGLFIFLSIIATCGSAYALHILPRPLIRFIAKIIIGARYNITVLGVENIPKDKGVLLLSNHISWLDWAIIQIACPRPIQFVMFRAFYQKWYLKWLLDMFNAIPISASASRSALQQINRQLSEGQIVCLFPEGTITRTGQLSEFKPGFEGVIQNTDVVILPLYLHGLWGSWFSRSSKKLQARYSTGIRTNIVVAFGKALASDTKAEMVKQQVFELSIDAWGHSKKTQTIACAFVNAAKHNLNRPMIFDATSGTYTGCKILASTICLAQLIKCHSPEKNIGLLLPTSSIGAMMNMAVLMSGKTVVNLNFTAGPKALQSATKQAEINTIYTAARFTKKLSKRGIEINDIFADTKIIYIEDLGKEISRLTKLIAASLAILSPAWLLKLSYCKSVDINSPAAILFSSGSEGDPKGVMLSHKGIMANIKQVVHVLNMEETDRIMATLPLFHAFGLTVNTLMPMVEEIPMICHPDPTDALNIAREIARNKATILCSTATFLRLYIKNKKIHPLMLGPLRIVVAGAEKLSPSIQADFKLKFNKDIYEGYGATETAPVASVNTPDILDPYYWQTQAGNKPGTVGMPLPGSSFRIVDPTSLESVANGEDGLILIGGVQLMLGYLKNEQKTNAAIIEIDGKKWYKTVDKGRLDRDGFLTIIDRYSRFAKLGGEMISLTAVEEQVRIALARADLELAALNLPDEKKGERILLLLAEEYDLETIKKAMLAINTTALMIPSELKIVDEIPKLGSGKIDFKKARTLIN